MADDRTVARGAEGRGEDARDGAPEAQVAMALTGGAAAAGASLGVRMPGADQLTALVVRPGDAIAGAFSVRDVTFAAQDGNLVLGFANGGRIVLAGFAGAAQSPKPPVVIFNDGTKLAGDALLQRLAELGQTELETAAGQAAPSGGGSTYADDFGDLIGGLNAQGARPGTALAFGQPRPTEHTPGGEPDGTAVAARGAGDGTDAPDGEGEPAGEDNLPPQNPPGGGGASGAGDAGGQAGSTTGDGSGGGAGGNGGTGDTGGTGGTGDTGGTGGTGGTGDTGGAGGDTGNTGGDTGSTGGTGDTGGTTDGGTTGGDAGGTTVLSVNLVTNSPVQDTELRLVFASATDPAKIFTLALPIPSGGQIGNTVADTGFAIDPSDKYVVSLEHVYGDNVNITLFELQGIGVVVTNTTGQVDLGTGKDAVFTALLDLGAGASHGPYLTTKNAVAGAYDDSDSHFALGGDGTKAKPTADAMTGDAGKTNVMSGGDGHDNITAADQHDFLFGEQGDDSLSGGAVNDVLSGGGGNDALMGDGGDDLLIGGAGDDQFWGDSGNDSFVFNGNALRAGLEGHDVVHDYHQGDVLVFEDVTDHAELETMIAGISDSGGNLTITFNSGDSITLMGAGDGTVTDFPALESHVTIVTVPEHDTTAMA
jgi:Ca2+-binding RTX toxin-like protein